jgi:hypothetical protein
MNYPDGPNQGPARTLHSTHPKLDIARIEYTAFTRADCGLAWKIFTDWKQWRNFSNIYGKMEWRGSQWQPGSRMQIEIVQPVVASVDHVITVCTPPRCVAWIDHALGYTTEQWVLFDPAAGGTKISTWLTSARSNIEGYDVQLFLRHFTEEWYSNFAAECDRVHDRVGKRTS